MGEHLASFPLGSPFQDAYTLLPKEIYRQHQTRGHTVAGVLHSRYQCHLNAVTLQERYCRAIEIKRIVWYLLDGKGLRDTVMTVKERERERRKHKRQFNEHYF